MQLISFTFQVVFFVITATACCFGQAKDGDVMMTRRDARHDLFVATASDLQVFAEESEEALKATIPSLLRYNNPVRGRFNDAETFVFTTGDGCPKVLLSVSLRSTGKLFMEAVSVSPNGLKGQLPRFGKWAPKHGGSGRVETTFQSRRSDPATRRLVVMRRIANSVTFEFKKREWTEARLLTQPIYRYSSPEKSITDGAIFAYSESNDPEGFLHVWHETSEESPSGKWYWLAAASTSLPLRLQQEDQVQWEKSEYWSSARNAGSAYVETLVSLHPDLVDLTAPE